MTLQAYHTKFILLRWITYHTVQNAEYNREQLSGSWWKKNISGSQSQDFMLFKYVYVCVHRSVTLKLKCTYDFLRSLGRNRWGWVLGGLRFKFFLSEPRFKENNSIRKVNINVTKVYFYVSGMLDLLFILLGIKTKYVSAHLKILTYFPQ